jgi:hypothetical protein
MNSRRRTRPYTIAGLRRVPCSRCGAKPSHSTWQACADGRTFRALCAPCDALLNWVALDFVGDPERDEKIARYIERLRAERALNERQAAALVEWMATQWPSRDCVEADGKKR